MKTMTIIGAAAALALAACAQAPTGPVTPEAPVAVVLGGGPPAGGWPKMGRAEGTLGGSPVAWESYDFSVGAYDASAYIWRGRFHIIGYTPGQPDDRQNMLYVRAPITEITEDGLSLGPALVGIVDDRQWDSPRLRDVASKVTVTRFSAEQDITEGGYGHVAGTLTAQLCAETGGDCQPLVLRFDTEVQISEVFEPPIE